MTIDANTIKKGTFILAKSWHPEITQGGIGVAMVVEEANATSFLSIEWIKSVINPHAPCDLVSVRHFSDQYTILSEEEVSKYVPNGWTPKAHLRLQKMFDLFK